MIILIFYFKGPRRRQHQQNCPTSFGDCGGVQRLRTCPNRARRSNDNPLSTGRRQLHDEQLQNLYSQVNII